MSEPVLLPTDGSPVPSDRLCSRCGANDPSVREAPAAEVIPEAYRALGAAAAEILPLIGEMVGGEFNPLPHPSLTGTERKEIAPWIYVSWCKLLVAVEAVYGVQSCGGSLIGEPEVSLCEACGMNPAEHGNLCAECDANLDLLRSAQ